MTFSIQLPISWPVWCIIIAQYTVSTYCFHPRRKPTTSLETGTVITYMYYRNVILMFLSIHLSVGVFLRCNFFICHCHCIVLFFIVFMHVCCVIFNKVSLSVALLHHQALILDRLLTFLMTFSSLILKPSFSQSLSLYYHLSLAEAHLLKYDRSVFDNHCRRRW